MREPSSRPPVGMYARLQQGAGDCEDHRCKPGDEGDPELADGTERKAAVTLTDGDGRFRFELKR